jgi:hypothetical protein
MGTHSDRRMPVACLRESSPYCMLSGEYRDRDLGVRRTLPMLGSRAHRRLRPEHVAGPALDRGTLGLGDVSSPDSPSAGHLSRGDLTSPSMTESGHRECHRHPSSRIALHNRRLLPVRRKAAPQLHATGIIIGG